MSSVKELLCRRKKPRISHDDIGPEGFIELNNELSISDLVSGEVEASTASQHPQVPVVPVVLPSIIVTGGDATLGREGEQIDEGDVMSLAQHRPRWQNRQLPMRFRDVLPQPPPTVPLETDLLHRLVWQYFSSEVPSHDPEEYVSITDLSFIPGSPEAIEGSHALAASTSDSQYHPYPNHLSFELGDWYWNQGLQKSQGDYEKLLQILGGSSFNATDVGSTHWKKINSQLGSNEYNKGDGEEWEDEDVGWKRTAVTIQVPFSCTTKMPGPRLHEVAQLYHRSLVAVLQEKLANA
ncbi:hypothetical protein BDR05DRAFT_1000901 [Suillus weaverae]|nr:hypothetical protein BDR05DRAFT_1000901 [Suillus weaverae]